MTKGFWGLVEEMAPVPPGGGEVIWRISTDVLMDGLRARGLQVPSKEFIEDQLVRSAVCNPGFPWAVTCADGQLKFVPV